MLITSRQNPKVKYLVKLDDKKFRDEEQKMRIEGYYPLTFALNNDYPVEEVYICKSFFREKFDNLGLLKELEAHRIPITEVDKYAFEKLTNLPSPEGLLAIAPQKHRFLKDHTPLPNSAYVVIESIERLSNLAAIFRLTDNSGTSGVIVCDMQADIFNSEVIRASLGTIFSINILEASSKETIEWLKKHQIKIYATSPNTQGDYLQIDFRKPLAIILGGEYTGLSEAFLKSADAKVKITMFGQANSLSVTATAAILLYEVLRQRQEV